MQEHFPREGRSVDQVIADLQAKRANDVRWADGRYHLIAMTEDPEADSPVDAFAVGDALLERGWFHDRQSPPDSLHSTVSNSNDGVIEDYLKALSECVDQVRSTRADDRSTHYATLE